MVSICIVLLCLIVIGLIGWRCHREYVVKKITLVQSMDPLMKKKIFFYKQKMRQEHALILLGISSLSTVSILLLILGQLVSDGRVKELRTGMHHLQEEMRIMRNEQSEWLKMPIFAYPSDSFFSEMIDWSHILVTNDLDTRFEMEQKLSYHVSPFLGRTMVFIFIDQPMQEISLTFVSRLESLNDLIYWEQNMERLVEDMADEPLITQGSFSVQLTDEPEASFEQVILRDDDGNWEKSERRLIVSEKTSETDLTSKSTESDSVETKESSKEEEKSEQKGSVHIHE